MESNERLRLLDPLSEWSKCLSEVHQPAILGRDSKSVRMPQVTTKTLFQSIPDQDLQCRVELDPVDSRMLRSIDVHSLVGSLVTLR